MNCMKVNYLTFFTCSYIFIKVIQVLHHTSHTQTASVICRQVSNINLAVILNIFVSTIIFLLGVVKFTIINWQVSHSGICGLLSDWIHGEQYQLSESVLDSRMNWSAASVQRSKVTVTSLWPLLTNSYTMYGTIFNIFEHVLTFYVQMVKGQPHGDMTWDLTKLLWLLFNAVNKGRGDSGSMCGIPW